MLQPLASSNRRTFWDCADDGTIEDLTSPGHYEQYARLIRAGDEIFVYSAQSNDRAHLFVEKVTPLKIRRLDIVPRPAGRPKAT